MSKIESGKVRISQREFHLRNMVQDISAVIYPQTVEHGLAFDLQIDQSVPAVCIGDEREIKSVLAWLAFSASSNASRSAWRVRSSSRRVASMSLI